MKIEKDAEWNRLEGRAAELRGKLNTAKAALTAHIKKSIAEQLGVVTGETIVESGGDRFLVSDVEPQNYSPWLYVRKIRKDGQPSERVQCLYNANWTVVQP